MGYQFKAEPISRAEYRSQELGVRRHAGFWLLAPGSLTSPRFLGLSGYPIYTLNLKQLIDASWNGYQKWSDLGNKFSSIVRTTPFHCSAVCWSSLIRELSSSILRVNHSLQELRQPNFVIRVEGLKHGQLFHYSTETLSYIAFPSLVQYSSSSG